MRVDSSAQGAVPVTPSDTVSIAFPSGTHYSKGIYIGVTGDLVAVMADGTSVTFKAIAAGVIHPISAVRIDATSTTATDILAVY